MIIDDRNVTPNNEYNFTNKGNHTVYLLLKSNISSLTNMFHSNKNIISISFLKFLIQKI